MQLGVTVIVDYFEHESILIDQILSLFFNDHEFESF